MNAEGWYLDPFHAHELRWFSNGVPTDLVRDGDVEAFDIPPTPTWDPPVAPPEPVSGNAGVDLFRADERTRATLAYDEWQVELEYRRRHPWAY